ncbi:hypothetical protein ElyMa_000302700 [Elysia marginata]|uniref:Peptidase S1 domain-containing protein n=1 Tax=Elysia marginata TaxID=1093978 RepID=A0AAV4F8F5_9GAST|nr:hypothetical protein ElyMa_000302700 [Elysia marginata]
MSRKQPPGGKHECEIFGREHEECKESEHKWMSCEKNPGHQQFICAEAFRQSCLSNVQASTRRHELIAMVDLTVRLRVRWTSLWRPDNDDIAEYKATDRLRVGTGFIRNVSHTVDKRCPCCLQKRKHWEFYVRTALHVVYDTAEATQTKVDLFFDEKSCQLDGRMKTVTGLEVAHSKSDRDWVQFLCATHDEQVGERIQSAWYYWMNNVLNLDHLRDINLVLPSKRDVGLALIVSHPHGQPKKITVGDLEHEEKSQVLVKYRTHTCPGSSGAPVFVVDKRQEKLLDLLWVSPVHSGSYWKTKPYNILEEMFIKPWGHHAKQTNYGYKCLATTPNRSQ